MKYTLHIVGPLCIIGLVCLLVAGCSTNYSGIDNTKVRRTTVVTTKQYEYLKAQLDDLARDLYEFENYLERDPKFLLYVMDHDLDAVERGGKPRGSFSDYFVPNMAKALAAGVAKKDVMARLDRVVALAEKKIYLSRFVAQLMEDGGPTAVRSYANEWIGK